LIVWWFRDPPVNFAGDALNTKATETRAQQRSADNRQLRILRLIDEGTAAQTGVNFFRALVERLAQALDARYAFVSHFCDENTRVHVLAMWNGQSVDENFYYQLAGSPCEGVLSGEIVAYNSHVVEKFPREKEDLEKIGAESYLAIPLRNVRGEVLGHLAVIDTRPKDWAERDFEILRIFAARATAEIERQIADREMQAANAALARRVELEGLIASISTRIVTAEHGAVSAEIERTLGTIGQFIGGDRGLLYRFDESHRVAKLAFDWSRAEAPGGSRLSEIRSDVVPEVLEHFLRKGTVNAARPEFLPPGFAPLNELPGAERVASRIAVPIVHGSECLGILCFHSVHVERRWPTEDLRLLGMLAEIIGSALAREQSQVALQVAKNAAETANRAKTEFLANMSHELRTPLNGILGYAQLLKRSDELSPGMSRSVEAIEHCGDHLLMLISEILDLAKIEAGRLELENSAFELSEFLTSVADIARVGATQAGLIFSHETRSAVPHVVTADRNKLRQILLNLLGNAVKFTESGTIAFRVSAKACGNDTYRLRFEVEDTGLGIAADELELIFRPFHQIKRIDRQVEGTGLGLAICRKLIDLMAGTLEVRSTLGKGSIFCVELDVRASADRVRPASPIATFPNGYLGPRRRVLIADDNADNRQVLGQFLRSLGFEVAEAHNGVQAVQTARTNQPDLILMDLVMPLKDGFQAASDIRSSPETAAIPIVAISASAFPSTRMQCADAGCQAFITKPIRLEEVSALLKKILGVEWTYASDPAMSKMPGPRSPAPPSMAMLPRGALREVYQLARSGDVHRLEQRLRELRIQSPGMEPAVDALLRCVSEFDMARLRALLQPLIEGAA
jgi:signal transduction histidine kinase/DNA-binding NarL/FixJ family response regulator